LSDGLLLFQGSKWNMQIPAKLYEYFRARKPILAFVDKTGDTAAVLREAGMDYMVDIGDTGSIIKMSTEFIRNIQDGSISLPWVERVQQYSRYHAADRLANLFSEVTI